jgi:tRNA modification GTPase
MHAAADTIAAIATAPGAGGIGIVRISGPRARAIGEALAGTILAANYARLRCFRANDGATIDEGIALFYQAPRSYPGEDVVELQAHGSPPILARLLRACLEQGARMARPGEFTERAFLNHKLDLAQAEAVADLIAAGSERAARAARRSLEGEFSRRVDDVLERLTGLRVLVEATLDFPEEGLDFLAQPQVRQRLEAAGDALAHLLVEAGRGTRLREGLHVVIVGEPNTGKSSLLNALAGEDRAIVSASAGTTRDLVREALELDGVALTLVDTAGLRDSTDAVEAEGIRRAHAELARADLALAVLDARDEQVPAALVAAVRGLPRVLWLHNKADLTGLPARAEAREDGWHCWLSVRTGNGMAALRERLREEAGAEGEGSFSARARHVAALEQASSALGRARDRLREGQAELAAEELRLAQQALGEITGVVVADDLLGRIFSEFCIGK